MNNFLELVKQRISVREYTSQEVEQEKLDYIFESVRLAPSAVNFQPWKFFVIRTTKKREELLSSYPRKWFATAPIYIVACCDKTASWKRSSDNKDHGDIDVAIAVEHLCLAAAEQGLGTCWVCNFDISICKQVLDLPDSLEPVAIIPLGYPVNKSFTPTLRKETEEIISFID